MAPRTQRKLSRYAHAQWIVACFLLCIVALPYVREAFERPIDISQILPNSTLRVGLDPSRPPFAFFTPDGAYTGLEIDLAHAIGQQGNVEIVFVPLGFDGLYDALRTNQADIVIAGQEPSFRQEGNGVVYTRHYFDAGLVLVSSGGIETPQDLPGHALAYTFGTPEDALAHQWLRRVRPFELRPYEIPEHALKAVRVGDANAALVDGIAARLYLQEYPTFNVDMAPVSNRWFAVTIRDGRPDLLTWMNDTLRTLDDNGTLDELINQWL
jgi:ABC-type amino acid transport substrate-binding protein